MSTLDPMLEDFDALSEIGQTPEGGVHREAASVDDGRARDWLKQRLLAEGLEVRVDRVGNMFAMIDLAGPDAPAVMAGSHLDSQPHGGRFDGPAGVLTALHAALALRADCRAGSLTARRNICLVNWTNEEGSRFAPSLMGSAVFAGLLPPEDALQSVDRSGTTLREALGAIGYLGSDAPPTNLTGLIELHIEQGTALEQAKCPIAVVEGAWGAAKYIIEITGRASHTGPTPMRDRRDALIPAAALILQIRALSDRTNGELLSSVGRVDVSPNSTNVVADKVRLFAELRDRDARRLEAACEALEGAIAGLSADGIAARWEKPTDRAASNFDPALKQVITEEARKLGIEPLRLTTVAGHDALNISRILPAAMIFVPSRDGITHNPLEYTAPEDLLTGARVLKAVLRRLVSE